MGCMVLPTSVFRRSRLAYRPLQAAEELGEVRVLVGKERREFLVDPYVLEERPLRALFDRPAVDAKKKRVVLVENVDSILFEHLLWLLRNDYSSLRELNLREVIDFYAQD